MIKNAVLPWKTEKMVSIQHPRKLLKPSGEQALRPDFISFLGGAE
jgi:hypothetical protein